MDETTGEGVKLAVTKESASEASGSCRVLMRLEARFRRFRWDATRSAKLRQGATSSLFLLWWLLGFLVFRLCLNSEGLLLMGC